MGGFTSAEETGKALISWSLFPKS